MDATHSALSALRVLSANDTITREDALRNIARSAGTGMGLTTTVEITMHPVTRVTIAWICGPANLVGEAKKRVLSALRVAGASSLSHVALAGRRLFVREGESALGVSWAPAVAS